MERCEYELWVESYFGLKPEFCEAIIEIKTDYGQLVNLLATFDQQQKDRFNKWKNEAIKAEHKRAVHISELQEKLSKKDIYIKHLEKDIIERTE